MSTTVLNPTRTGTAGSNRTQVATLSSLDAYAKGQTDYLVYLAWEYKHPKDTLVDYVMETRCLTRDHAQGVVDRRWPSRANSYDQIHLADNEWGNHIMEQVAAEWFKAHPLCNFVSVYEHAGWALGFYRHESGGLRCYSSANGDAKFPATTPHPTIWSGEGERRKVKRPDIKEVTDLTEYLAPFKAELARELDVHPEEMEAMLA